MEFKKKPEANLENKKTLYFLVGLLLALGSVLVAFEYTKYEGEVQTLGDLDIVLDEEEMIPITQQTPPPPPPPPMQTTVIQIVEDNAEIEQEVDMKSTDSDEDDVVEFVDVPEETGEDMTIFTIVEEEASFPGGVDELYKYMRENTKFPAIARDANIGGRVYVKFVVEKDGSINKDLIEVARSVHPALDAEAVRVVKSMPKWSPARQRGKPVRQYFSLPVNFIIR
jgi:periplasmic protein TonB